MSLPRSDVAAALLAWISATHDLRSSGGGDECRWSVTCPETGQAVAADLGNVGLSHRRGAPAVVRACLEEDVLAQIERYSNDVAYRANPPAAHARAYGVRPVGPVLVLRRLLDLTADGSRGELALDVAALVAAGRALAEARRTAPVGQHRGTRRGHLRDLAAVGLPAAGRRRP